MKNTGFADFEHYHVPQAFIVIEEGIYQAQADMGDLSAGDYVLPLCFQIESEEENANCHYLLEDILERYNAFSPFAEVQGEEFVVEFAVSDYLRQARLAGIDTGEDESLPGIRQLKADLLGARVIHRTVDRDDGQFVELVIEK